MTGNKEVKNKYCHHVKTNLNSLMLKELFTQNKITLLSPDPNADGELSIA